MKTFSCQRFIPLLLPILVSISVAGSVRAQSSNSVEPEGNSIIRGRVVFDHNSRTVRRPSVLLYKDLNHPAVKMTVGNSRGEFRFTAVAAGSYFVVADYPGVISKSSSAELTDFGLAQRGDEREETKVTVDGANEKKCEVRLVLGNAISGTVTYSDKEPALRMRLILYRRQGGVTVPTFSDPVTTDDRGNYRVEGLPSGEYFVAVSESGPEGIAPMTEKGMMPLAFYPGVSTFKDAKAVQLSGGSEAKGISFVINESEDFEISGIVKWRPSGKSMSGTQVTLRRKDDPQINVSIFDLIEAITPSDIDRDDTLMRDMSLFVAVESFKLHTVSDSQGQWRFKNLPKGTYLLTVVGQPPREGSKNKKAEADEEAEAWRIEERNIIQRAVEIEVNDEDAQDIVVEMTEGSRILGSVMSEDSLPQWARVVLSRQGPTDLIGSLPYETKEDGTFVAEGIPPGEVRMDVALGQRSPFYLASITLGGNDLMREPLKVIEGTQISGVRVTLATGLAKLTGRVVMPDGSPDAGAVGVLVMPGDPKLLHLRSRRRFQLTSANGEFSIDCPPGNHLIFTWPAKQPPVQAIEEFVKSNISTARRISLSPKEQKTIDLVVAPNPKN
jgi:hypothetical protein